MPHDEFADSPTPVDAIHEYQPHMIGSGADNPAADGSVTDEHSPHQCAQCSGEATEDIRAPIERSLASQLAPHEFRACIAPEEFEPRIWRDICRIYARHWLENLDNWPVASLFAYQLACSPLVSSRLSPTRTSTQPRTREVLTSSTASQQC